MNELIWIYGVMCLVVLLGFFILFKWTKKTKSEQFVFIGLRRNDGIKIQDEYNILTEKGIKVNYLGFEDNDKLKKYHMLLKGKN